MVFLQTNALIFVIAALLLAFIMYLETKVGLVSKHLQMKPIRFYIFYLIFAVLIGVLNFVAIEYFGSWQSLILTILGVLVIVAVVFFILKVRKTNLAKEDDAVEADVQADDIDTVIDVEAHEHTEDKTDSL